MTSLPRQHCSSFKSRIVTLDTTDKVETVLFEFHLLRLSIVDSDVKIRNIIPILYVVNILGFYIQSIFHITRIFNLNFEIGNCTYMNLDLTERFTNNYFKNENMLTLVAMNSGLLVCSWRMTEHKSISSSSNACSKQLCMTQNMSQPWAPSLNNILDTDVFILILCSKFKNKYMHVSV